MLSTTTKYWARVEQSGMVELVQGCYKWLVYSDTGFEGAGGLREKQTNLDWATYGKTSHVKVTAWRWASLACCRGELAIEGTTGLLLVYATGCSTTHRSKTSGVYSSE
jgi:hypothetical protein